MIGKGKVSQNGLMKKYAYTGDDLLYLKSIYKSLGINYPKFYKMDPLCKLAFLSGEFLLEGIDLKSKYDPSQIALVFSNSASSLFTDINHTNTILDPDQYFPKPAVFVYTLPNIMLGELSIRHTLKGENVFFVSRQFDAGFMSEYTHDLLNTTRLKACIVGWVDYLDQGFESAMFLIENMDAAKCGDLLSPENLEEKIHTFANL